jgi:hypothetical protein
MPQNAGSCVLSEATPFIKAEGRRSVVFCFEYFVFLIVVVGGF